MIVESVRMYRTRPVTAKLVRRSVCPCGAPVVQENIPLGKRYIILPETVQRKTIICVPCGRLQNVTVIQADDLVNPVGWIFLATVHLDEGYSE